MIVVVMLAMLSAKLFRAASARKRSLDFTVRRG